MVRIKYFLWRQQQSTGGKISKQTEDKFPLFEVYLDSLQGPITTEEVENTGMRLRNQATAKIVRWKCNKTSQLYELYTHVCICVPLS